MSTNARKFRLALTTLTLVALLLSVFGAVPAWAGGPWYVDANTGNDGNNCLSTTTACQTIGAAIGKADDGDTINVAAGTYDETLNIDGRSSLAIQGEDRDTAIFKPSSTISWAIPGYPQYNARMTAVRIVNSTDIVFDSMTFDFDLSKGGGSYPGVFGLFGWDSSVTVDNCVLKNMSVSDASGGYYEITSYFRAPGFTDASRADIVFTDNIFIDPGRVGIVTHDYINGTVSGNTFYKTTNDFGYAVEMGSQSTGVISGNTIYGYDTPAASDGSESAGIYVENCFTGGSPHVTKAVSVTGNEIYDCQYAMWIGNGYNGYAGDVDIVVTVSNNNFHDNVEGGIILQDEDKADGSSVNATFQNNTVANNGDYGYYIFTQGDGDITADLSEETITGQGIGVYVEDTGSPSSSSYDVTINGSNITGNTTYGVNNTVTGLTVDAEYNWWGDASGPSGVGPGSGDAVSTNVNYWPWLGAPPEPGTIIVEKQTDPDGAPDTFTFIGDATGTISDGQRIVVGGLQPGTYTSQETVPAGWDLTSIVCDDSNSSGDVGTGTATFRLEAGETVTCIFTNTQQPGTIIVEKQTDPDGAPDTFTFTGDAAGTISDGGQIVVSGLQPGTYTSQETVPAGWNLTDIQCDDDNSEGNLEARTATFQLEAGETVKCTFYNHLPLDYGDAPDSYGTLLVSDGARHVIVSGHHMGATVDAEPDGQPDPNALGDDQNILYPGVPFPPGDEDGVTLPLVLTPGATVTVTVDGGPSGGMLDAWIDFNGSGVFDHSTEHLWGGTSMPLLLAPNLTYLSFPVPAGATPGSTYARFRLSMAGVLSPTGRAPDGEVEDYLVEIEYLPGTIIVEKQTDPDGKPDNFTFIGDADGIISDGQQIVVSGLQPGTYTSTETVPAGWDLTSIVCHDNNSSGNLSNRTATFRLEAGETVTCTFTNVQRGSITIAKETDPDGGTGFDFSGDLGGFSLDDDESQLFSDLLPGHYDVTEAVPAGWDLTKAVCAGGSSNPISNGVRVNLGPGDAIVCTFTNVQRGSITIVKETDPDGGAGFNFSGDLGGFSLDDDGSTSTRVKRSSAPSPMSSSPTRSPSSRRPTPTAAPASTSAATWATSAWTTAAARHSLPCLPETITP
jgi:hypothetical protein